MMLARKYRLVLTSIRLIILSIKKQLRVSTQVVFARQTKIYNVLQTNDIEIKKIIVPTKEQCW
jgi:hypothetical protein